MPKKKGEQKVVAWFIPKKSLIKFDGEEDSIAVADNVMEKSNFEKYPVMKGDTVEVSIKDDEVIFLRKVADSKKSEKKETKKESAEVVDTITKEVFCVSKYGLKFVGDNDWTNFSDELQKEDVKALGVIAKNTIKVGINEKGKIVTVENQTKKEEKKSDTSTRKSSYRDEESMDKRTASMNAKDVVVALLNNKELDKSKVKNAIEDLTKTFYEVTKNL